MKPLCKNEKLRWNEALCRNWLIDTKLSVDCRILGIVEFDLKLLDFSKKPTIWTRIAKTTSNWKIPVVTVGWKFSLINIITTKK